MRCEHEIAFCLSPPIPHNGNYSASKPAIVLIRLWRRNPTHPVHLHACTSMDHYSITVQSWWLRTNKSINPVWKEESTVIYRLDQQSPFVSYGVCLLCLHSCSEMLNAAFSMRMFSSSKRLPIFRCVCVSFCSRLEQCVSFIFVCTSCHAPNICLVGTGFVLW